MSIAKIGFVLAPTCYSLEIVVIDDVKLVHLLSALSVETHSVEVDSTLVEHVLRMCWNISQHDYVINYL